MALKQVMDAVAARLAANWTACPVVNLNRGGKPPAGATPYLLVTYPVANSAQITIGAPGANVWREEGAFRLILHVRRTTGLDQGLTWADELAALFRGKEFGGVQTFAPTSPAIDDRNENGLYFVLSIAIPYQFDLIG